MERNITIPRINARCPSRESLVSASNVSGGLIQVFFFFLIDHIHHFTMFFMDSKHIINSIYIIGKQTTTTPST